MQKEEPFVKKNVSKEVSILHHGAQVFRTTYIFPGEVLKDLSGEAVGRFGEGGSIRKPGDLLSEWERRRPDIREKRGTASMRSPAPTRPGWEEGKWGTKDAHGPCSGPQQTRRRSGQRPRSRDQPSKTPPQRGRVGRAEAAAPPALGNARGEAASHPVLSALRTLPSPLWGGQPAGATGD